jgi:hypothetical protein
VRELVVFLIKGLLLEVLWSSLITLVGCQALVLHENMFLPISLALVKKNIALSFSLSLSLLLRGYNHYDQEVL